MGRGRGACTPCCLFGHVTDLQGPGNRGTSGGIVQCVTEHMRCSRRHPMVRLLAGRPAGWLAWCNCNLSHPARFHAAVVMLPTVRTPRPPSKPCTCAQYRPVPPFCLLRTMFMGSSSPTDGRIGIRESVDHLQQCHNFETKVSETDEWIVTWHLGTAPARMWQTIWVHCDCAQVTVHLCIIQQNTKMGSRKMICATLMAVKLPFSARMPSQLTGSCSSPAAGQCREVTDRQGQGMCQVCRAFEISVHGAVAGGMQQQL